MMTDTYVSPDPEALSVGTGRVYFITVAEQVPVLLFVAIVLEPGLNVRGRGNQPTEYF